jgi:bifunctional UDP-N-acetylglucosamine pyrophosphorylase/glucosamine-1-phosphate N-acetyltransferase
VSTLLTLLHHDPKTAVCVLGFRCTEPNAYGRMVRDNDGTLERIVEYKDADERERALTLCNSGVMAIRGAVAWELLGKIGNTNAKNEYYLTDIVALAREAGYYARIAEATEEEVLGVNSRVELAEAEAAMQARLRTRAMDAAKVKGVVPSHPSHGGGRGSPTRTLAAERALDAVLADSFPASDPPPWTLGVSHES